MKNPTRHKCAAVSCRRQIESGFLMCRDHWFKLPADLRKQIGEAAAAMRRGGAKEKTAHLTLAREAMVYIRAWERENYLGEGTFEVKPSPPKET